MREMTLEEIKQTELEILKRVANFCDAHGIRYFLAYGTLIGAIRHKGFIPWDDDIDIVMPEEDYQKFLKIYKDERYPLFDITLQKDYIYSLGKVVDSNTIIVEKYVENYLGQGVYVDIFPLVYVSDNSFLRWITYNLTMAISRICVAAATKNVNREKYSGGKFIVASIAIMCAKICSVRFYVKLLQNVFKFFNRKTSTFMMNTEVDNHIYCADWFRKAIKGEFEGCKFNIPSGYDAFLTNQYGDYMQLPPEEDRVSNHSFVAYWKD